MLIVIFFSLLLFEWDIVYSIIFAVTNSRGHFNSGLWNYFWIFRPSVNLFKTSSGINSILVKIKSKNCGVNCHCILTGAIYFPQTAVKYLGYGANFFQYNVVKNSKFSAYQYQKLVLPTSNGPVLLVNSKLAFSKF